MSDEGAIGAFLARWSALLAQVLLNLSTAVVAMYGGCVVVFIVWPQRVLKKKRLF